MTRRVKLSTALHRTLEQRGTAPAERDERALVPAAVPGANGAAPAPRTGFGLGDVGRALSSAVYGVGYYSSFGIVFGVMAVWHLLPLDNALGRGFRDGGEAGRRWFARPRGDAATPRSAQAGVRRRGAEALAV